MDSIIRITDRLLCTQEMAGGWMHRPGLLRWGVVEDVSGTKRYDLGFLAVLIGSGWYGRRWWIRSQNPALFEEY